MAVADPAGGGQMPVPSVLPGGACVRGALLFEQQGVVVSEEDTGFMQANLRKWAVH